MGRKNLRKRGGDTSGRVSSQVEDSSSKDKSNKNDDPDTHFLGVSMYAILAVLAFGLLATAAVPYLEARALEAASDNTTDGVKIPPFPTEEALAGPMRLSQFKYGRVPIKDASKVKKESKVIDKLMKQRMPFVLRGLPSVSQWDALEKWSPKYLCGKIGKMKNVLANSTWIHKFLYVDTARPMLQDAVREIEWRQPYWVLPEVECSDFLETVPEADAMHMYYSRTLTETSPALLDDIDTATLRPDGDLAKVKMWLSHPNVTAHVHYDNSDNLFVQVVGRKRFTVFPPEQWDNMYLYPRLHPATRQSRVEIDGVDLVNYPEFWKAAAHGLQVELQPGDMMFVPAFWFHYPQALDTAVSVMTFRPFGYKGIISKMASQPLPIKHSPEGKMYAALYLYFSYLIEVAEVDRCKEGCLVPTVEKGRLVPSSAGRDFVKHMVERRWMGFEDDLILGHADAAFYQNDGTDRETHKGRELKTPPAGKFCSASDLKKYGPGLRIEVRRFAEATGKILDDVPPGPRQILLGDYMEELLANILSVHEVHGFFVDCFVTNES